MNLIAPTFLSFLRNKKITLYILSISVIIGVLIAILNIKDTINNVFEDEIKNNVKNRIIYINKDEQNLKLENIKELNDKIQKLQYTIPPIRVSVNNYYEANIKTGYIEEFPKVENGINIQGETKSEPEIIIPDTLGEKLQIHLDSYIELKYENLIIKAKVVGIYEELLSDNYIYMDYETIKTILTNNNKNIINKISVLALIDKYENIDEVINELQENGYSSNLYDTSGLSEINTCQTIFNILNIFIFLMITLTYFLLSIIINNIINDERKDIAILKAIGYNNKKIIQIIFFRIIFICFLSFTIGIIFSFIIQILLLNIIKSMLEINVINNINLLKNYIISAILLLILIVICSIKNSKKIEHINAIILLKE